MHLSTVLGTRHFWDRSRYHIRVRRPQKTIRNNFRSTLFRDEYKLPKKRRIPAILGTRYSQDQSRCHIRVRRPQKPPETIFTLFYTKMNKNSRRRCSYPPSWTPGISRTEPDVIFVIGDLKNHSKIIFTLFCTKVNENSRNRYTYPPSWAPMIPGTKPMSYSCSATSKAPINNFHSILYQDE